MTALPSFGTNAAAPSSRATEKEESTQDGPRRQGKASKPVSIFARGPVYCRTRPCDVAVEHDDHTCYDCEQRLLNPDGDPTAPWRPPLLPACDLLCDRCSRQKCCLRELHDFHACGRCECLPPVDPTPVGGGDPWAAEDETYSRTAFAYSIDAMTNG